MSQGLKFNDNESGVEVWVKPLKNDDWAICFLNKSEQKQKIDFDWSKKYIGDDISNKILNTKETSFSIEICGQRKILDIPRINLIAEIPLHDVLMVRLIKQ